MREHFDAFFLRSKGEDFLVLVDPEDFEGVEAVGRWSVMHRGGIHYVRRNFLRKGAWTCELLHNLILGRKGTDHVNGIGTDNRKENLRAATHAENMQNRRLNVNSRSGYRGVSWISEMKKWRAEVQLAGKKHHLGYFDDKEAAARAAQRERDSCFPFANEARHQTQEASDQEKTRRALTRRATP